MSTEPQRFKPYSYHYIDVEMLEKDDGHYVLFSDYEALKLLNQRNEDGLRQIQDIAEQFVGNPGCELNTVDLVKKMAEMLKDY